MRIELIDGGCSRRLTAADRFECPPSDTWASTAPLPEIMMDGTGEHACVTVLTGSKRRAGVQTGAGLDLGRVSLVSLKGLSWLGPDLLSFRMILRGHGRSGTFERVFVVNLATEPAHYLVRDLASGRGADVCSIPSVDRKRVWMQVSGEDEETRGAFLSVYSLPDDALRHREGFPVLVEACGTLLRRFSLSELTLGAYERCDASMGAYVDWLVADVDGVVKMTLVIERRPDWEPSYWEAMYEVKVFPDGHVVVESLSELLDPAMWKIF